MISRSRILILGSSGFIGQHLLRSLNDSEGISLRDTDWRDKLNKGQFMINLVGKAHDHKKQATQADFFFANFELAKQIFQSFINSSASLLIHVSSLAAVEEIESSRYLTELDPCNPTSWYGKSKRAAEEWLVAQDLPHNKKLIILRPPMVHGPGDKGNLKLLYQLVSKGIPFPLASFDNNRSIISIYNFRYFIEQIIKYYQRFESGIYHISDDEEVSTKRIISIIESVTSKNILRLSIPQFFIKGIAKIGDFIPIPLNSERLEKMTSNLLVSNSKIKAVLDINNLPLTAEEGLGQTIRSFNNIKA